MTANPSFPKNTAELLICCSSLFSAAMKAREDDGKISPLEWIGILSGNSGKLLAGITGLAEIDDEIKNFDGEILQALAREVLPELDGVVSEDAELVIDAGVNALIGLISFVRAVHQFRNPPVAEVLPEEEAA